MLKNMFFNQKRCAFMLKNMFSIQKRFAFMLKNSDDNQNDRDLSKILKKLRMSISEG